MLLFFLVLVRSLPGRVLSKQQGDESLTHLSADALSLLNRYPSPTHNPIKERVCTLRGVPSPEYVFLGVGSDEVIDLVVRVCCAPGKDKVLTCPPTYGMYGVTAQVNDVEVVKVPLDVEGGKFSVKVDEVRAGLGFQRRPLSVLETHVAPLPPSPSTPLLG